jgi:hypothetical protein
MLVVCTPEFEKFSGKADNQVNLLASQKTSTETSNSAASVGVAAQLGNANSGIGITASASAGKGAGSGNGTTYTNTQVAGSTVNITTGGDTTLKGAVVKGNTVNATIGGDLKIESLQDTNTYKDSSQQVGGSVMVGLSSTGPVSGSLNLAQTKINSDFKSVGEQSAIRAGDGGFNVSVAGKTTLTGGQITSTQAAVDAGKNAYTSAGGTTTTDLQNSAAYNASSVSIGLGAGSLPGKSLSAGLSGVGIGSDKASANSTTTSGISGVAGNTAARTGDKETGIGQIFDKDKTKADVTAQVAITSEFGKQASKAVGDYAGKTLADLKQQASNESDPTKKAALLADAAKWEEGGASRVALHTVVGGLTGGAAGAVGAGAASAAAPSIDDLQSKLQDGLKTAGLGDSAAKAIASLASGATAAGIGAAASGGSVAGAATAFNADMNNRQLHPTEVQKAKELAAKSGGKYTQAQIEEQLRLMGNAATGELPNTTTVLTNTNAIVNSLQNDPSMPKTAQGTVVMEVPGQANAQLQSWIMGNTTQGAGFIPGQTPYTASNAALNAPVLTNTPNNAAVNTAPTWSYMGSNSAGIPTGKAKVPDGSYGIGLYPGTTPGGEVEMEVQNGSVVGAKVGVGFGVGGHLNLGTQSVGGGLLKGPVSGAKDEAYFESNPLQAGEARIGPSVSVNAGAGTVGLELGASAGKSVNDASVSNFVNRTASPTIAPVIPKISAEIKVNVIEFSVKSPNQPMAPTPEKGSK